MEVRYGHVVTWGRGSLLTPCSILMPENFKIMKEKKSTVEERRRSGSIIFCDESSEDGEWIDCTIHKSHFSFQKIIFKNNLILLKKLFS